MAANIAPLVFARRTHSKSRSGCAQCRARHIKCDEKQPLCLNCSKHFVNLPKCDFSNSSRDGRLLHRAAPVPLAVKRHSQVVDHNVPHPHHLKQSLLLQPSAMTTGPGLFDPFDTHPHTEIPEAQKLMHHFISMFKVRAFPIDLGHSSQPLIQRWWPNILEDGVLFHAALSLSFMDICSVQAQPDDYRSTLLLRRECVGLMRQRLQDSTRDTSDATISAVLFMAIVEHENDNKRMVRMHIEGLKRMVACRGGLSALDPSMANIIFGTTMTIMSEPQFPPDTEILSSHPPPCSPITTAPESLSLEELQDYGIAKPFATLFLQIKYMVDDFCTNWPQKPHPVYCSSLLQKMLYLPSLSNSSSLEWGVSESCRSAVALQLFWPFQQEYPSPRLRTNVGIHKLKTALEIMIPYASADQKFLTWLLFVGGAFAVEPERSWFVQELVAVADGLELGGCGDFQRILERYVWVPAACGPLMRALWREVETNRTRLLYSQTNVTLTTSSQG